MFTGASTASSPSHLNQRDAWAYVSPPLRGLTFEFGVCCSDSELGFEIDAMLAPLRTAEPSQNPRHWFALHHGGGLAPHAFQLSLDGRLLASTGSAVSAVAWLLWHLNRAVAASGHNHVLLHAGGVGWGDIGVVVPAPSGSGKSTLVGGLVQRRLAYLSDEMLGLTLDGSWVLPFPKPLSLTPDTHVLLFGGEPLDRDGSAARSRPAHRRGCVPVAPSRLCPRSVVAGATAPGIVVVPRHRPGRRTTLTPISPADAVIELTLNAVNLSRHRGRGVHALGQMARRCESYRLEMSDLDEACALVVDAVHRAGSRRGIDVVDRIGPSQRPVVAAKVVS